MKRIKGLVLVPSPNSIGGVSHYYHQIQPYLSEDFEYFTRGVRYQYSFFSHITYPFVFFYDIMRFSLITSMRRILVIIINTSFGITGIIRDSIFIGISKIFRKKIVVFFRGIDDNVISRINDNWFLWNLFRKSFLTVDEIWVLSGKINDKLVSWGYNGYIRLETTLVDSTLLKDYSIEALRSRYVGPGPLRILFMSRLEKNKGIYETIDSFRIFLKRYPDSILHICGDGKEKNSILSYINNDLNRSILFEGFVSGKQKSEIFSKSHLFIFPSRREGMPNVILEAMAFGLPILTTPVGGIADFFDEGKMGFLLRQSDPEKIAEMIETTLKDSDLCRKIATYNYEYAKKRFYAPVVAERIRSYYNNLILSDD